MNMDAAVWGVIGTLVGAGASIGTTWLTVWHCDKSKAAHAREERVEQARAFQRETLIHLQTTIHDLFEITSRAYGEGLAAFSKTDYWAPVRSLESEHLPMAKTMRHAEALVQRVADGELRRVSDRFLMDLTKAQLINTNSTDFFEAMPTQQFVDLNNALGTVLRSHFEPIPLRVPEAAR